LLSDGLSISIADPLMGLGGFKPMTKPFSENLPKPSLTRFVSVNTPFPLRFGSVGKEVEQLQLYIQNQLTKQGVRVKYPDAGYGVIADYTLELMAKHLDTSQITKEQFDSLHMGGYKTYKYM